MTQANGKRTDTKAIEKKIENVYKFIILFRYKEGNDEGQVQWGIIM